MLDKVQHIIEQGLKTDYFAKSYTDVRLSNNKLIKYNEDGSNGDFTGIQDVKENYFYIRVVADPIATSERTSTCGNNVMQATLRVVAVVFNDNVYNLSGFVATRLKASAKRINVINTILDYDTIWNNEMPGTEIKRYNALNVISIDFTVKFNIKQIISESPCKYDTCEDEKLCKDGFVIIKDELGNIILEQVIPSGVTVEKTIDLACLDATAVLKDTAGNILSTTDIPSGDSEDITAPDGTVQLFNTVPTLIQTEVVRSGQTESATIANVSWTDSDGSPESTPYGQPIVCTPASALAVDFSADDLTPDTNQVVTFTDLTVGATQWLWSFGDGNLSTLQNPTHTYKVAGVYSVTLCATDGTAIGKEIKTNYITVTLQAIQGTIQEYYEAGVGASPANMTLVSGLVSILNGSVNGFDVSSPVGNRPAYLDNQLNGYGCIEFDGINNYLRRLDATMVRGTTATIQMVMKRLELGTNNDHFSCSGVSNNTHIVFLDSARCMNVYNGGILAQTYQSLMNEVMIVTININGANSFIQFGDTPPLYLITTGTNTSSGVTISANASLTGFPYWHLFDKVIFSTPLTAGEIANNVERFKSKFDI